MGIRGVVITMSAMAVKGGCGLVGSRGVVITISAMPVKRWCGLVGIRGVVIKMSAMARFAMNTLAMNIMVVHSLDHCNSNVVRYTCKKGVWFSGY